MNFVCRISVIEKLLTMLVDREKHLFRRCISDVDIWRGERSRRSLGLLYMLISAEETNEGALNSNEEYLV